MDSTGGEYYSYRVNGKKWWSRHKAEQRGCAGVRSVGEVHFNQVQVGVSKSEPESRFLQDCYVDNLDSWSAVLFRLWVKSALPSHHTRPSVCVPQRAAAQLFSRLGFCD